MATNFHLYHPSLRRDREESATGGDLKTTPTNTSSSNNSNSNSTSLFGSSPKHTSHSHAHHRGFSFDKIKSKVSRRSSEPEVIPGSPDRRNSAFPMIVISESNETSRNQSQNENQNQMNVSAANTRRLRAQSLSLIHSQSRSRSGSRSRSLVPNGNSTSRKQTKELVKLETAHIISKKLESILSDLGLQSPIPLKATNNTSSGSIAKSVKVYIANTNDCIFLAPASSASFTYEDVENGGAIPHDDEDDDEGMDSLVVDSGRSNSNFTSIRRGSVISDDESAVTSDEEAVSPDLATPRRLKKKMRFFNSPNYLCTKIDSDMPIPHTFAVVIELEKDSTSVRDVKFDFSSVTNILWPSGDPYSRTHSKERFKIGSMEWSTSLGDSDFYINTNNSNDVRIKNITPDDLARRTREYKLVNIRNLADGTDNANTSRKNSISLDFNDSPLNTHGNSNGHSSNSHGGNSNSSEVYKAGLYVFLLPIILPQHIPPTIISINGTLLHTLSINFNKTSDMLNRKVKVCSTYNLPMVRTPPSFANSIADKPIYVNRVWNDSLHYIITFPKKYVSLGSEHVVNVKLVPLVKDVIIKRIKFNVLERITYVSKNLSKEYDFDSDDPYCVKAHSSDNRTRERVVSLCELKTKSKQNSMIGVPGDPYKEEVVKCPDNNLLFSCYEPDEYENFRLEDSNTNKRKGKDKEETPTMIASPLDINIALPFLTTRMDKTMMTSTEEDPPHLHRSSVSRKASITTESLNSTSGGGSPSFQPTSPIIGALETNLSHRHSMDSYDPVSSDYIKPNSSMYLSDDNSAKSTPPENIQKGFTLVSKALYPDSNFRHIQISHRLQVCFRISKPDPKDGFKMHHYEVVVDTPLILLSSKCNEGSIQLPKYDDLEGVFSTVDTEISFRTPDFERNGISIKRLDENSSVEPLPSFEEATSSPSSPITRSISIGEDPLSRIPSNNLIPSSNPYPDEPAPAYERSSTTSNHGSRNNSFVASSNIDEVVNSDSNNSSSSSLRRSTLRNSLSHSFAPSLNRSRNSSMVVPAVNINPEDNFSVQSGSTASASTTSGTEADDGSDPVDATPVSSNEIQAIVNSSDQEGDVPSIESSVATTSSNDDEVDSIVYLNDSNTPLAPRSSSTGLTSVDNSVGSEDVDAIFDIENSLAEVEIRTKGSSANTENPLVTDRDSALTVDDPINKAESLEAEDGDNPDDNDDLQGSLYTQESAFDQKFPLLNHGDVARSRNDASAAVYPIPSNFTTESEDAPDNLKMSNDNLSVADSLIVGEEGATRAQDIYHTYL
ncbi:hypothetical protein G9P44_000002 [Scheffersomyces stipitis]|nr:hypothetical protein G9P44_000002 [Scheffersomyces stipitis]